MALPISGAKVNQLSIKRGMASIERPDCARGVPIFHHGRLSVVVYDALEALPSAAKESFDHSAVRDFFFTADWYKVLTAHGLDPRDRVCIYAVEENSAPGQPVALLPTCIRVSSGSAASRRLRGLQNYYTSLFGPIITTDVTDRAAVLQVLARGLVADPSRWTEIDLHPLDRDHDMYDELVAALRGAGMWVHTYFCFGNWYLDVAGRSYGEYLASLPSRLRHTIERKSRALREHVGGRVEIAINGPHLDAAIAAYETVYARSWKRSESHPEFIRALVRTLAESGCLRLGLVYLGDHPIAAQIWIVRDGTAYIYKLAYDEQHAKLSAGTVLSARLMQYVIETDHVRTVDYLTGDDEYKRDWMSHRRERWGIVAHNPRTVKGLAYAGGAYISELLKRMARKKLIGGDPTNRRQAG